MSKSDGNPILAVQMIQAIEREGPSGTTSALLAVSEMREAIALQLEDLSAPAPKMLSAACVLGTELSLTQARRDRRKGPSSLLAHVEERALRGLDRLVRAPDESGDAAARAKALLALVDEH